VTKNRAHRISLSTFARRSNVTAPDTLVTDTCPEPAPTLPLTLRDAGDRTDASDVKSLVILPDIEFNRT
jgi:hypothetical protein